jgi:hypothetical protein
MTLFSVNHENNGFSFGIWKRILSLREANADGGLPLLNTTSACVLVGSARGSLQARGKACWDKEECDAACDR